MLSISQIREFLEFSPKEPGRQNPDLAGWRTMPAEDAICSHCAGRLAARGILLPREWAPLWAGEVQDTCGACGKSIR
jgi:hypothetical protein